MRSSTLAFSVLAILGGAQAAPYRGSCHARPHGSSVSAGSMTPSASAGTAAYSTQPAEGPASSSSMSSSSDMMTTQDSASSTFSSESSAASVQETGLPASSASSSAVSASEQQESISLSPTSAEPSVVSTPASSVTNASASPAPIGQELAVSAPPSSSSPNDALPSVTGNSNSAPSPSASAPSSPMEKRVGLGVNGETGTLTSFVGEDSKLGWYYNWALKSNSDSAGLEYVPMVWGIESVTDVKSQVGDWWSQGVTAILSFNEPDQDLSVGGSDIAPAMAAELHQQWVNDLGDGAPFLIGSPAVARGGEAWMTEWLDACQDKCIYDFVPFHFYGTDAHELIDYVQEFSAKFQKPLWLTEWACKDFNTGEICSEGEVQDFMNTAIGFFRQSGLVDRWAWFGAFPNMASNGDANGIQNTGGSVNNIGSFYLQL